MPIDLSKFQTYQKSQRRFSAVHPSISIQNTGAITLNEPAWRLFGEERPEALVLMYNPDERVVGLLPATTEEADAYKVNEVGARHTVNARRFIDAYDLPRGRAATFTPEYDPDSGLLYFAAPDGPTEQEPEAPRRRRRRRATQAEAVEA